MSEEVFQARAIPCQECQSGVCRLVFRTHLIWLDGDLISVPNFPTWVCDLCRWSEYDPRAVSWLVALINLPERRRPYGRPGRWHTGDETLDKLPPEIQVKG
jgi:hypothetical protein